jgi:hypothetical protein
MADAADPQPPPPPPPGARVPTEALEALGQEIDRAVTEMARTIEAAIAEHEAGTIDLATLQQRCLEAGVVRLGDFVLLWDWVHGQVYVYDGFGVTVLPGIEP